MPTYYAAVRLQLHNSNPFSPYWYTPGQFWYLGLYVFYSARVGQMDRQMGKTRNTTYQDGRV